MYREHNYKMEILKFLTIKEPKIFSLSRKFGEEICAEYIMQVLMAYNRTLIKSKPIYSFQIACMNIVSSEVIPPGQF
jgi:hypothetical protein